MSTFLIMGITLGWVFVIIFIPRSLVSAETVRGMDTKVGTFQVFQQHPDTEKCAETVLKENEYVCLRVSEQSGECEGLSHYWGRSPTMERGYAYATKLFVQENFHPPVKMKTFSWKIPGVLTRGAKLDMFFLLTTPKDERRYLELSLSDSFGTNIQQYNRFEVRFIDNDIAIFENEGEIVTNRKSLYDVLPALFSSKEVFKISFLAQVDSVTVLVEDKEIYTFKLATYVASLRQLDIYKAGNPGFIHGIQFTGN